MRGSKLGTRGYVPRIRCVGSNPNHFYCVWAVQERSGARESLETRAESWKGRLYRYRQHNNDATFDTRQAVTMSVDDLGVLEALCVILWEGLLEMVVRCCLRKVGCQFVQQEVFQTYQDKIMLNLTTEQQMLEFCLWSEFVWSPTAVRVFPTPASSTIPYEYLTCEICGTLEVWLKYRCSFAVKNEMGFSLK